MKLNLLKKLLCLSPVVVSPILVTACGSSNTDGDKIDALKLKTAALKISKVAAPGKFYLDFYQRELNAIWATKTDAINAAADNISANHQYDLQLQVLNEVLTKVKTDGASEFKKEFPTLDDYNANIFDDITVSFSIPDDSKGNLKVAANGVLSVYPADILSGATSEKHISYTLKLNSPEASAKDLSGSLKFDLKGRFIAYKAGSGLSGNYIYGVYGGNGDMSTILVGEYGSGIDVGTKQAGGGYKFDNYNDTNGLASNNVYKVYGSNDLSTILVGELDAGLDVGTISKADDSYTFSNYSTTSSGSKLNNNKVSNVYGNANLSTILVSENGGGLDVGTISKADDPYTFTNYSTTSSGSKLNNDKVNCAYGNADMSTILVGEQGGGLDVGTKAKAGDPYTFTNYSTTSSGSKLNSDKVNCVYGNADMSTILVGEENGGIDVGTRDKASDPYTFTNYSTASSGSSQLSNDYIYGVYGNPDMSKILVGGFAGLEVGTKQADGSYNFTRYDQSEGMSSNGVNDISANPDLSKILVVTDTGLSISSNLWFA